ncbi:MAG: hypothetical protein J7L47_04165 [Candidatus Odinarchaeota archaeon]|nr:hypothetical protein [Candidatus Odinarchaeota archaeon]
MDMTKATKLFVIFSLVFLLSVSTTAGFAATAPASPAHQQIAGDVKYIDIIVNDYGEVEIITTTFDLLNTNLSMFQISPSSENYAEMKSFTLSISDTEITLVVGYRGNTSTNTTYIQWTLSVHDKVTAFLGDTFTLSNEQSSAVYSDTDNETYYTWIWNYSVKGNIWAKIASLRENYVHNDFTKFLMFNSDWTFEDFGFSFVKNVFRVNATGTSIMEAAGIIQVFSGKGTHTFNLQKILMYDEPPYGIEYTLSLSLPSDAKINQSSIDAGNATILQVTDTDMLLMVESTQTIGPLSFTFDYNFTAPPPEEDNNENNSEEENAATGGSSLPSIDLLSGTSGYTIVGVIAVAIIFSIAKYFLKQRK